MILAELFARPEAWPVLLVVPAAAVGFAMLARRRSGRLVRAVGPRASILAAEGSAPIRRGNAGLRLAALTLALVALLDPRWGEGARRLEQRGVDVVVCLDVSRSMRARDLPPDRLESAKGAIRRLVERAKGDRFALVLFAGEARLAVPRTRDGATFLDLVERADPLDVTRGGTDLGAALDVAVAALGSATGEHETVVVLTDGEDHEARGLRAATAAAARGVTVHAVGVGTAWGAKIPLSDDPAAPFLRDRDGVEVVSVMNGGGLRRLAEATGGAFVDASVVAAPLEHLYVSRIGAVARKTFEDAERLERRARFQWPLVVAILLGALAFGRTARVRPVRPAEPRTTVAERTGATRPAIERAHVVMVALLAAWGLLGAGVAVDEGARAWREGRFAAAHEAFAEVTRAAGDRATAAAFFDESLAALRAGRLTDAEAAAERAAARGGPAAYPMRDFLLGNAAFARTARAESQASGPEAEPFAFDVAIAHVDLALAAWVRAATSRRDWPEARRNVERALMKRAELVASRDEARRRADEARRKERDAPRPNEPTASDRTDERAPTAAPQGFDEGPELERRLFELLARKEREKLAGRAATRAAESTAVEREW